MLGDSLSDAHHGLADALQHYSAEYRALPDDLRRAVRDVIAELDYVRGMVDSHQAIRTF